MLDRRQTALFEDSPTTDHVRPVRIGTRTPRVRVSVYDAYWRFAAERQRVFHLRAAGAPMPWTQDPIIARYKFRPGCLDGLSKMFTDTGGLHPADLIAWIRDISTDEFDRLGLEFRDLWGRWPHLIDWQNVFCEVSKYTRVSHPDVAGRSGRTRIKQEFRQTPTPIDYRFPAKWGLPPERTACLRP